MTTYPVTMPSERAELLADLRNEGNFHDIVVRAVRNAKFSDVALRMYLALMDTYPELLEGKMVEVDVGLVRRNAGEAKETSATNFFRDLNGIAFIYESVFDRQSGHKKSTATPLPDIDAPEVFDTKSVDRKRRAQEKEAKRRKQFQDPRQLMQCPECGSNDILYSATPRCGSCHTVYPTIENIPAAEITIDAEVIEVQEDFFLDEPTVKVPAIPRKPVLVQEHLPVPAVPALGRHRRGIACPDCGSLNHWHPVPTTFGTTIDECAICNP